MNESSAAARAAAETVSRWDWGEVRRRLPSVLAHGLMLAVVLLFFRVEKALQLAPRPGLGEILLLLLPEVAFLLTFEGLWLLAAGWRPLRYVWRPLFVGVHALVYTVAFLDHLWFLYTGTRLHLTLFLYSIRFFQMLVGLLATGLNPVFLTRLALVVLCFLLGLRLEVKRWPTPRRLPRAVLVATGAGLVLVVATWWPPDRMEDLWASPPVEFLSLRVGLPPSPEKIAPWLVPPEELYRPPDLAGPPPLLATEAPATPPRQDADRPNVVLLILESTRRDVVPPWAPEELAGVSPNLGAWAERAVVVDSVYATVTHTSKALVGILCGLSPRLSMPIVEAEPGGLEPLVCLPELLQRSGYRTAFIQSAVGAFENRPGLVRNMGFGGMASLETLSRMGPFRRAGYLGGDDVALAGPALGWIAGGPDAADEQANAGGGRDAREQPFFLTLLTSVPHHPYEVPDETLPWFGESWEQYLLAIHFQDRLVGRLMAGLEQMGRLDDTVVVILGDHGEAFGEHGRLQHDAVPYEEAVRVPMLILGPDRWIGPPRAVGGLRHQVDLVPTLLELADVPWIGHLPGRDLLSSPGHDRVFSFCWYTDFCASMREGDRTWIYHFGRRATELYDVVADPGQTEDLVDEVPEEERREAEARILGQKLSVARFWEQAPAPVTGGTPPAGQ